MRLREDEDASHGVLAYDGGCPSCSAAATALRRVPGVGAIVHSPAAQRFLEAQFREVSSVPVFDDAGEGRVYVGREASRELCERAGLPGTSSGRTTRGSPTRSGRGRGGEREPTTMSCHWPSRPSRLLAAGARGTVRVATE